MSGHTPWRDIKHKSLKERAEEARIALEAGDEAVIEHLRGTCTCGKGDDAPAIVHADDCPCIDWVFGQLEGG